MYNTFYSSLTEEKYIAHKIIVFTEARLWRRRTQLSDVGDCISYFYAGANTNSFTMKYSTLHHSMVIAD